MIDILDEFDDVTGTGVIGNWAVGAKRVWLCKRCGQRKNKWLKRSGNHLGIWICQPCKNKSQKDIRANKKRIEAI